MSLGKKPNTYNNVKCCGSGTQIWQLSSLYLGTRPWNASLSENGDELTLAPTTEQLISIQKAKIFCFQHQNHWYGSSEARWHDFCTQLHMLSAGLFWLVALQGWDQSSEMERAVNTKSFSKNRHLPRNPMCWQLEKSLSKFSGRTAQGSYRKRPLENRELLRENRLPLYSHNTLKQNISHFFRNCQHRKVQEGLLSLFLQV